MLKFIKNIIKKYFIKERIVPFYVKEVSSNLLVGKSALVTGGTSGIGLAIAKKMIEAGCCVTITGRNEDKLKKISSEIKSEYLVLDISNLDDMYIHLDSFYKTNNIDILVNSAGYHGLEKFRCVTEKEWHKVMDVNVKGLYFLSQYVANKMIKDKIKGHILNLSSASSLKPSWTPYEISKRAVSGITLGLAQELIPYGIVVNAIAPGPTATPMLNFNDVNSPDLTWKANPSGRVATVEEIANLALFMVSSLGDYIVGDTFYMTGGSGTIDINK